MFSDVRYILKPESVIANNFQVPSHTLTLGIPKFNPDIEFVSHLALKPLLDTFCCMRSGTILLEVVFFVIGRA